MKGARLTDIRSHAMIGVLALALFFRLLVPSGWMPAATGSYSITLCTGMGIVEASVDKDGKVHKNKPAQSKPDQPCAFSGFSAALDFPPPTGIAIEPIIATATLFAAAPVSAFVGHGLAAPPPPPTGPPATL